MSALPSYETLSLERDGAILRVWLDRPERRNALNSLVLREIGDLFSSLETDFDTRVVVLGGRGPSFCAGADRKPAEAGAPEPRTDRERRWTAQLGRRACRAIEDCEAITIARVHGYAIGGGSCLALSCDFRVAANDAIFRVPEVDLGVPLTWAAAPRLIQEVGTARTREILLLCDDIDGVKAHAWGMAHRAVPIEELDATVDALATRLADKPEMAVYMTKTQLRGYSRLMALGDMSESDSDMLNVSTRSESARGLFQMPAKNK